MELSGGRKGGGGGDKAAGGGGGKKPPGKAAAEAPRSSAQPKKSQPGSSKVSKRRKELEFKMTLVAVLTMLNQCLDNLATVFCWSCVQAASGPVKKGKPASAAGGKAKKAADGKESVESELSVSFSPPICLPNYM